MYFTIISEDVENSTEKRKQARVAHLQRLHVLNHQGRLLLAGPHVQAENDNDNHDTFLGSLIVAEFDCLDSAQKWAEADPYVQVGVYAKVTVKPFIKVLP
jgi:uncharacterized protein YciI